MVYYFSDKLYFVRISKVKQERLPQVKYVVSRHLFFFQIKFSEIMLFMRPQTTTIVSGVTNNY